MTYVICALLTLVAISVFHRTIAHTHIVKNYAYILSMGLPLFFNIKRKDIRNICLTLAILAIFMQWSWIGLACIVITYTVVFMGNKKFLAVWIPACLILSFLVIPHVYPKFDSIGSDSVGRIKYYEYAMQKWQHKFLGEGFRAWSRLPENQPGASSPIKQGHTIERWAHVVHSDLIQGLIEFGAVRMFYIVCLLILPIALIRIDTLFNKTLLASYLCLLFQACVDFPFHRAITGSFGVWLILMMYREGLSEECRLMKLCNHEEMTCE